MHALGLPAGSVRALMAVGVFATVWGLLLVDPSREVPDYLRDLLFIIMGHYFASRRRADSSAEEPGPPPLYLPRGSVRLLLVAGCAAVAVVLYRRGRLTALEGNPGAVTLLLVGGFFLGVALSAAGHWWKGRGHTTPRFVEDARALVSMAAAVALVVLVWNRLFPFFPPEQVDASFSQWVRLGRYGPEHVLAAVVGFYFGSRS
jgi:hypothetical protein